MRILNVSLLVWTVVLLSCNSIADRNSSKGNRPSDPFYTDKGGFGTYLRIPLIKPYEAIKVSEEEWRIELQVTAELLELSIHNVKEINVQDGIIFIHSKGGTSIKHVGYEEAWFVIAPSRNIERGFSERHVYLSYLKGENIKEPRLQNIDAVYDQFRKEQKIMWNEDF